MVKPLPFSLLTHSCEDKSSTTQVMKFVDDRMVAGPIAGKNEMADGGKVEEPVYECLHCGHCRDSKPRNRGVSIHNLEFTLQLTLLAVGLRVC